MHNIYKFSPIKTKEKFFEVVHYIDENASRMCSQILGVECPISSLTIFSHYDDECSYLTALILQLGEQVDENNGFYVKLYEPIQLRNGLLSLVRIRKPDPYRMQVGCCDLVVPDYFQFKDDYLMKYKSTLRLIERPEYEMIEFFHPDFDVLAYVVSPDIVT